MVAASEMGSGQAMAVKMLRLAMHLSCLSAFSSSARRLKTRSKQPTRRNAMNRRNVLSLSAITALGLAVPPGNAVAQPAADMEGVKSSE
jgi:hypothetical protein